MLIWSEAKAVATANIFCASLVRFSSRWAIHKHTLTFELVHISSELRAICVGIGNHCCVTLLLLCFIFRGSYSHMMHALRFIFFVNSGLAI